MQYPLPEKDYTVLVVTYAYNQEKFIAKAIESILMQQTNFPFVLLILDDCSTDSTADIIREYESKFPDLIKGIYQEENYTSQGKCQEVFVHPWQMRSKYQAFCEGDDYWTDPYKLQKQVDFMEAHPNCTLSFHSVVEHWEDKSYEDKVFYNVEDRVYSGAEIFRKWIISTSSTMFRTNITNIPQMQQFILTPGFMYYDIVLFLACGVYGEIRGIPSVMGVYRRLSGGFTLQLWENKMVSTPIIWKYCIHNHRVAEIFGPLFDSSLKNEAINRFVGSATNGVKVNLRSLNLKNAFFFLKQSFAFYPKETIRFYKGIVCRKLMR